MKRMFVVNLFSLFMLGAASEIVASDEAVRIPFTKVNVISEERILALSCRDRMSVIEQLQTQAPWLPVDAVEELYQLIAVLRAGTALWNSKKPALKFSERTAAVYAAPLHLWEDMSEEELPNGRASVIRARLVIALERAIIIFTVLSELMESTHRYRFSFFELKFKLSHMLRYIANPMSKEAPKTERGRP